MFFIHLQGYRISRHADEQLTIYKTIVILGLSYYLYINVFPFFRKNLQSTKFRFFGTWYKINTFICNVLH